MGDAALTPRDNFELIGQDAAEKSFLQAWDSGRLAQAWLLTGPKGIGKATLAFRIARFVLAGGGESQGGGLFGDAAPAASLQMAPEHPVFRRISSGGHADFKLIERGWSDDKKTKRKSEITVDDVRDVGSFMSLTPAEGGWRVVLVDAADEMNRNSANAILKVLEEPPKRALLLLVGHSPGRLLPTIRSRCRRLSLQALSDDAVINLLGQYAPDIALDERQALARLADGSIGRALDLSSAGSLALYREMVEVLATLPDLDMVRLQGFAERFAKRGEEANADWRSLNYLFDGWLKSLAQQWATGGEGESIVPAERGLRARLLAAASLDRWMEAWEKIAHLLSRADAVNLDRKQTVLGSFLALQSAMR